MSPAVYSGGSSHCGYTVASPSSHGTYTPISVTFTGGTYGDHISIGGQGQPVCQNATCTFNPGQYQCHQGGFSGSTQSIEIGSNASNCTVNFNSGSYTFLGNVSIAGNNTVTLQPGTYYGGITINGNSGSPDVTFSPGTYYIGGGGLQVSGQCSLHGSGCTFYNTSDTSSLGSSSGPVSIGANYGDSVHCDLSAPTSGSLKGVLFFQDSSIGGSSGSGWWRSFGSSSASSCTCKGDSSSTFNGALYFPGASLAFGGSSGSSGYTIVVADSVELAANTTTISCDYSSLTDNMSPITSCALYK